MTTTPSETMSEATVPVKVSPCCVVALSRVWVMRMGIVVPGLRVTLRKVGWGGGGGGGGGSCAGAGAGAAATCGAGLSTGAGWRMMGAGFDLTAAAGCFDFEAAGNGGGVDGGGVASAVAAGAGAGGWMVRVLTMGLPPGTCAASADASEGAAWM